MSKITARIDKQTENEICEQIVLSACRTKNGKVKWSDIERTSGFSRQALSANLEIKKAYCDINQKKSNIKSDVEKVTKLENELASLKSANEKLKRTIKGYDEKYVRWLYNATGKMSIDELNGLVPQSTKTSTRLKAVK